MEDIISSKDLLYISDMFNWNFTAVKQICNIIDSIEDNDAQSLLEEVFKMHYENCHKCIKMLKKEHKEIFMEDDSNEDDR